MKRQKQQINYTKEMPIVLYSDGYKIVEEEEEEEEYKDDHDMIIIHLKSTDIQLRYSQLCKYSSFIPEKFLISDIEEQFSKILQEFEEANHINEETIVYFFQLFNEEKVAITNDKYRDLLKISDFLKVDSFSKRLKKYAKRHFKDVDYIITKILEDISMQSDQIYSESSFEFQMEQYLINQINKCFINDKFKKLPVSLIYRIIEKSDKADLSHDLLFDFIKGSIDQLFILFTLLDYRKLSLEKFQEYQEMILNAKDEKTKRYLQYLSFDFDFIQKVKKVKIKKKKYKNDLKQKEAEVNDLNIKINQIEDENKKYQKQIKFLTDEILKYKKDLEQKNLENKNLQNKIDAIENENRNLIEINKQNEIKQNQIMSSNEKFSLGLNFLFSDKYILAEGKKPQFKEITYFIVSSTEGNCLASYLLGILYERGEFIDQDFTRSFEYFEISSLQGNSYGYNKIGSNYKNGLGVEQNYSKAIEYFKKSVDLGNSSALINLGVCYENGIGVEKDYSKAFECYQQSLELANLYSLIYLGNCYENGRGVEQNYSKAFEYYRKSAEIDDSRALNNLGICFYKGQGVEQDYSKAFEYYRKSASLGNSSALINLGICYENGQGIEQNYSLAHDCYQKAIKLGNLEAKSYLDELKRRKPGTKWSLALIEVLVVVLFIIYIAIKKIN